MRGENINIKRKIYLKEKKKEVLREVLNVEWKE